MDRREVPVCVPCGKHGYIRAGGHEDQAEANDHEHEQCCRSFVNRRWTGPFLRDDGQEILRPASTCSGTLTESRSRQPTTEGDCYGQASAVDDPAGAPRRA